MQRDRPLNQAAEFERLADRRRDECYVLRLYVTGLTPRSTRAIANLGSLCEEYLAGRHELEVIDLYQQPELAQGAQLVAAPTLVKELPLPVHRLIGDLSDQQRVLVGLGLHKRPMS
jgi:circadian clock protein KaiB